MIPFPDISPELFSFNLGGFEIALRWYALSYIFGFVFAALIMRHFVRQTQLWRHNTPPMDIEQVDSLISYLVLGVIIGGRLGYVLFYNLDFYVENPSHILRVWDGGMAFHGGFIGVVLAVILYCRFNGIPIMSGADLIALASPPGLMLGRIANFINAELWGRPTDMPWGVIFPGDRAQDCPEIIGECARHPSQLYEAGMEGFLLFFVLIISAYTGRLLRPGFITGLFICGYGLSRFYIEFFRLADPQFTSLDNPNGFVYSYGKFGITMGQALSVPMIIIGLCFIAIALLLNKKSQISS